MRHSKWPEAFGVGAVAAGIAIAVRGWPSADAWAAASAVGTFTAAFVALWASGATTRDREKAAWIAAGIAAVSAVPKLQRSIRALSMVSATLDIYISTPPFSSGVGSVVAAIDQLSSELEAIDAHALHPIPSGVDTDFAAAFAEINSVRNTLQDATRGVYPLNGDIQGMFIEAQNVLSHATSLLVSVEQACRKVALDGIR